MKRSRASEEERREDDIYGDLDSSIFSSQATNEDKALKKELERKRKEVETLGSEVKKLKKENKNYARNISSLYNTAKNEIDKKNFIIKQMQTKLQQLTEMKVGRSAITKAEATEIFKQCKIAYAESHSQIVVGEIKRIIEEIKNAVPKESNKKTWTFKNFSLYVVQEQCEFVRDEQNKVTMGKPKR